MKKINENQTFHESYRHMQKASVDKDSLKRVRRQKSMGCFCFKNLSRFAVLFAWVKIILIKSLDLLSLDLVVCTIKKWLFGAPLI